MPDSNFVIGSSVFYQTCKITWVGDDSLPLAKTLSKALGFPLVANQELPEAGYSLWVTQERVFVELRQGKLTHQLWAEFLSGPLRYRLDKGGGLNQAIAKAVGLKSRNQALTVLDGTAGLGKDGFILAMLGCQVKMVERSKVMFALLQDGLGHAEKDRLLGEKVKANIQIVREDFIEFLKTLASDAYPDVIYLDPMFPQNKKSALTKMEMRIIRDIVASDNSEELLRPALEHAKKRVVVKRAKTSAFLQGISPSYSVSGKRNRYDVYLTGGNIQIHENPT